MNMHAILPLLAIWAGHTDPQNTTYYLRLTAEHFPDIQDKMDNTWDDIFNNIEVTDEIY